MSTPPPPLDNGNFYIDNNGSTLANYTALITVGSTIISFYTIFTYFIISKLNKKLKSENDV